MSTADRNFTVKLTLAQANLVRKAIEARVANLRTTPSATLASTGEGAELMELEALLRISF